MTDLTLLLTNILAFAVNVLTLALLGGIFYVIGTAILTMARNNTPKWTNIAYILVILAAAIALLQFYPRLVVAAIRQSLQDSRPEALLLQQELQQWIPAIPQMTPLATPVIQVDNQVIPAPTFTPWPTVNAAAPVSGTVQAQIVPPTPYPTYTPYPTQTPVPTATPCVRNGMICPPTPVPAQ